MSLARPALCAATFLFAASPALSGPFESPAGFVILKARLEGRHALRLLLDTGDPLDLTLHEEVGRALGLSASPPVERDRLGLGGRVRTLVRTARIGVLEIEGLVWRDREILLAPAAPQFEAGLGERVDGFLGTGLLRELRLVIDYPARTLSLSRHAPVPRAPEEGGFPPDAGSDSTRLHLCSGRPFVNVLIHGREKRGALIDTASAASLIDVRISGPTGSPSGAPLDLVDGGGAVIRTAPRRLASLGVGGATLENILLVPLDLRRRLDPLLPDRPAPVSFVIGADLLSAHQVVLDFAAELFRLEPPGR